MQRREAGRPVEGAPQGLAIERHHALAAFGEPAHESEKAGVELGRIEQPEHPREGIVAGNAVLQPQELAQERLLGPPEQGHIRTILAPAQDRA